jgi:ribonuclease HII
VGKACIGIDENGLGSQLGPLIVTAAMADVTRDGERFAEAGMSREHAGLLGDSKTLVSHQNVRLGEAWARVLLDRNLPSPSALLERLLLDRDGELRGRCPSHVAPQCWSVDDDHFEATEELLDRVEQVKERLSAEGMRVHRVRSMWLCTRALNDAFAIGQHRFIADLHAMENLVISLRAEAGHSVEAVCGKVGGIASYGKYFGPLGTHLHTVLGESREQSSYEFANVGRITFLRDADSSNMLVALASLVGKYVRELSMRRVAGFYTARDQSLSSPSGYHDPVTNKFVANTLEVRRSRRIPDTCFIRRRP